MVTDNYWELWD